MQFKKRQVILLMTVCAICFSLASCEKLKMHLRPSKQKDEIDFGKAGETPERIWQESDYIICNSEKYRCVEK